jgi:signal transduction histidine kinase
VSRACYNKFIGADVNTSDIVCAFEWCNKQIKPSIGSKIPANIVRYLIQEDFRVLTLDNALNYLPEEMRPAAKPLLLSLVKDLNIESIMTYPHYIDSKLVGLLTFDICKQHKGTIFWSKEIKEIIKEVVSIVSNHIAQKQAESELQNYQNNLEILVEQRTNELIRINKQLEKEIAERKRTQEALKIAEKMEIIGLMASGVAHDLNNILSGIVTCPDMLLLELSKDSPHRELVQAIKTSGLRAVSIVQDLLTLSKGGYTEKECLCINTVVSDYLNSLEFKQLKESRPKIDFEFAPEKDIKNINASTVHVLKIIMNIVLNAVEAITDTGKIIIMTKNQYLENELKGYENIPAGRYVVLSIKDNGRGIPQNDLHRIFEPFYTKKIMKRKGTGLGLAIVWKTVRDHNGYIDVTSSENKGARFDIYIPAFEGKRQ